MTSLSDTFSALIETVKGNAPLPSDVDHTADTAGDAYAEIINATILPRRVTAKTASGARVSVIAKNRRIVKLIEVHPETYWDGAVAPHETECSGDAEAFSSPFASTFVKIVGKESIRIETAMLSERVDLPKSGYLASKIPSDVAEARENSPVSKQAAAMFTAFPNLPRARFGSASEIIVPEGSAVATDWMATRAAELKSELAGVESDIRFVSLDGEVSHALALVWLGGEGCLVLADTPDEFGELERHLGALRQYL